MRFKEIQEQASESRVQELKRKLDKAKEKKKQYKEQYEKAQNNCRQLTLDLQERKKELATYLIKID